MDTCSKCGVPSSIALLEAGMCSWCFAHERDKSDDRRQSVVGTRKIPTSKSCLYFLKCKDPPAIKIGRTRNLEQRLRRIQSYCAGSCSLLLWLPEHGGYETALHKAFEHQRLHHEWFTISGKLKELVRLLGCGRQLADALEQLDINCELEDGHVHNNTKHGDYTGSWQDQAAGVGAAQTARQ